MSFNTECNKERGYVESLSSALGYLPIWIQGCNPDAKL